MKKKVSKSDKVTLETLDSKIDKLNYRVDTLSRSTNLKIGRLAELVESLAISTAKSFESLEYKSENISHNLQSTRRDMLSMGDKFVSYNTFDKLALRVAKLEKNKK